MLNTVRVPSAFAPLFEKAQEYVSRYFSEQRFTPEKARVEVSGQRYIFVRAQALSVEFFETVERLYPEAEREEALDVARRILFDVAHAMGMADAASFAAEMKLTDPISKLSAGPIHFAFAGWALVEIAEDSRPSPDDDFYLLYDHPYSFESDAWVTNSKTTTCPVCVMNAGYSSGWCERSFEMPLLAVELLCRARGDDVCRFIMAPPARLDEHIERYRREHPHLKDRLSAYRVPGFFAPRSNQQLQRANLELEDRVKERTRELNLANQQLELDIAEKNRAELELSAAHELNERLIEALPGGVVRVQRDGSIIGANAEAQRILGLSYDDLAQLFTADFSTVTVHEDGRPATPDEYPVSRALTTGQAQPGVTLGVRRPAGDTAWAVFRAVPIKSRDGQTTGAVVTFIDITERKQQEDERQALELKLRDAQRVESLGVLAGGIAHDFNNLLATILGNATFARSLVQGDTEIAPLLDEIELGAQRAAELTKQMLSYSGKGTFDLDALDLPDVVRELTHLLKASIHRLVELHYHFQEELPPIEADATQVRQVIMNLITNAAESLQDQRGRVVVSVKRVNLTAEDLGTISHSNMTPGRFLCLEVSDSGCGMDAETQSKIFDPFFTTKFSGRGLGLASALGIMRGHGGGIGIESEPGKGTRVRALFPVRSGGKTIRSKPTDGATVLVVDDDRSVRLFASRTLAAHGYRVLTASDGLEALQVFEAQEGTISLVIMDLTMPEMSGAQTLARIRRRGSTVPVLLSSGYSVDADELDAALFDGFLGKPYRAQDLLTAVATSLSRSEG